ncbi:hypothetical protein GQ85_17065 [Rhodococcus rhodochrous]|nr:hypothetical protein GQ85_17065 [Rhodococcus rhodochrous]
MRRIHSVLLVARSIPSSSYIRIWPSCNVSTNASTSVTCGSYRAASPARGTPSPGPATSLDRACATVPSTRMPRVRISWVRYPSA